MAYEVLHGRIGTLLSGGTLTQFTFGVAEKTSAGVLRVVTAATAGTRNTAGIIQNNPTSGQSVELSGPGSISKLKLGSACVMGNHLMTDASGQGVTTSATGSHYIAKALSDGSSGDIIEVLQGYFGAT